MAGDALERLPVPALVEHVGRCRAERDDHPRDPPLGHHRAHDRCDVGDRQRDERQTGDGGRDGEGLPHGAARSQLPVAERRDGVAGEVDPLPPSRRRPAGRFDHGVRTAEEHQHPSGVQQRSPRRDRERQHQGAVDLQSPVAQPRARRSGSPEVVQEARRQWTGTAHRDRGLVDIDQGEDHDAEPARDEDHLAVLPSVRHRMRRDGVVPAQRRDSTGRERGRTSRHAAGSCPERTVDMRAPTGLAVTAPPARMRSSPIARIVAA